jgi:hypothetical protein
MTGDRDMFRELAKNDGPCKYVTFGDNSKGKQVGGSHPVKNIMTTRRPLELLHMDLFGPNSYKSLGGNSFGLVIVDDFSRFTWVFFLDDKSQVQKIF